MFKTILLPVDDPDLAAPVLWFVKRLLEREQGSLTPLCVEPGDAILEQAAQEGVDLVAVTTHRHTGFDRWMLGSVAEKVLRNCPTPILVERVAGPGLPPDAE
jgi:nucleotide-binding universal stress UspA family protein